MNLPPLEFGPHAAGGDGFINWNCRVGPPIKLWGIYLDNRLGGGGGLRAVESAALLFALPYLIIVGVCRGPPMLRLEGRPFSIIGRFGWPNSY